MSLSKTYNAVVVGLGNIGMGYDYHACLEDKVLTHSSAYFIHSGFNLIAGIDPDSLKCMLFKKKYNASAYKTVQEFSENVKINMDIVSLATPEDILYPVFLEIIRLRPKAILLEKPGGTSIEQLAEIGKKCNELGILLFINYFRRCEPGVNLLREHIVSNKISAANKIICRYTNGFKRNASHFINLIDYLYPSYLKSCKLIKLYKSNALDFEADILFEFKEMDVYFIYLNERNYRYCSVEFISNSEVIFYNKTGREISMAKPEKDLIFPDYFCLSSPDNLFDTEYDKFQYHVVDHIYDVIVNNVTNVIDFLSAYKTYRYIESLSVCFNDQEMKTNIRSRA